MNLHFLSPYAKDYQASLGTYDYIFILLPLVPDAQVTELLNLLKHEMMTLKKGIIENKEDKLDYEPYLNCVLVWSHIFIQMLMTCQFTQQSDMLAQIASEIHELRLMPMPYGSLPHELVEVIDNERILPGISQVFKLGEDFPMLNQYNSMQMLEANQGNLNWQ